MPFGIGRALKSAGRKIDDIISGPAGLTNPFTAPYAAIRMHKESQKAPSQEAAETRAKIAREQWEDYKARFQPLENILLGYANNKQGYIGQAVSGAVDRVNQAYDSGEGQIQRRIQSYGLTLNPEEQQRLDKRMSLERNLGQVQASNIARREAQDQIASIIGGGLSTPARGLSYAQKEKVN